MIATLLLILSILLSSARNIFSKRISSARFGTRRFFLLQALLFSGGAAVAAVGAGANGTLPSRYTVITGLIYGVLLLLAQWLYTAALASGKTALCSTVYSLGFVIPTLYGALIAEEGLRWTDGLGVLCAALAVVLSGVAKGGFRGKGDGVKFVLILAMLASGGLGVVQKLHQSTEYSEERGTMLLIAFALAATVSVISALISPSPTTMGASRSSFASALTVGVVFGICNLLNTRLAGLLPGTVLFPTLNIGTIILTMLAAIPLYKELPEKKDLPTLLLGGAAILLLNI